MTAGPDPRWYRAATLRDRLTAGRAPLPEAAVDIERGKRRLAKWRAQAPFGEGEFFAERLGQCGIGEEELAGLLGEPAEALMERMGSAPAWLGALHEAYAAAASPEERTVLPAHLARSPGAPFWGFVEPIVRRAGRTLAARLREVVGAHPGAPLPVDSLGELAMRALPRELIEAPVRTLVLEMHVARLEGALEGDTPEARFASFAASVERPARALALLAEYPVLARRLVACAEAWRETTAELFERLCRDWPAITSVFAGARAGDVLVELRAGAGDRHRGGRAVAILTFRSGFKLVYKPRSLAVELHFQELLRALDDWGHAPGFRTIAVLDRGAYGWVEHVTAAGCASEDEVRRFHRRQGGHLALLYALRANDVHFENVIACGEHPVLIDLEAILQPGLARGDDPDELASGSLLGVGLLPVRLWESAQRPGVDLSALGAAAGQTAPRADIVWENAGTDQMRLVRKYREIAVRSDHRPKLGGEPVTPLGYVDELVGGFVETYELLLSHRRELLAEGGPIARLASDEVRVILRPTQLYGLMLQDALHPDLLRDALDGDRFLDKLWVQVPKNPALCRVVQAEQDELRRGDIPCFTTRADSRHLWSGTGERLDDFLAEPALALVRRRIEGLGARDLSRQTWIVRTSMALLPRGEPARPKEASAGEPSELTAERLLELAGAIGDRLGDWALEDEASARWLGLLPTRHGSWAIGALDAGLYSGTAGLALFLAYLGHVTALPRPTALAEKACRTMLARVRQADAASNGIGAFDGLGGVLYTLCHLSALWDRQDLLREALGVVEMIPARLDQDERLDIVGGAAGAITCLATLRRAAPSEAVLRVMVQCGERLLARARPEARGIGWITTAESKRPLAGFAHGAAGMALALFEVAAASGEARFFDAARAALEYERGLFSPEHENWPDLRLEENAFGVTNWCHGAPGIGLARLRCLRFADDAPMREEIAAAARTTVARGFGRNHSLCHGDLGNLEVLHAAHARLPELGLGDDLRRLAARTTSAIAEDRARCGLPIGAEIPSLMVGLAGIGHGLLRLAAPERVPSVLGLEPPRAWDDR